MNKDGSSNHQALLQRSVSDHTSRAEPDDLGFRMTELEEQLAGPDGAAHKTRVLERLDAIEAEIAASVKTGLSKTEFQKAEAVLGAVGAARELIENTKAVNKAHT